jgi:hypothetical protein
MMAPGAVNLPETSHCPIGHLDDGDVPSGAPLLVSDSRASQLSTLPPLTFWFLSSGTRPVHRRSLKPGVNLLHTHMYLRHLQRVYGCHQPTARVIVCSVRHWVFAEWRAAVTIQDVHPRVSWLALVFPHRYICSISADSLQTNYYISSLIKDRGILRLEHVAN